MASVSLRGSLCMMPKRLASQSAAASPAQHKSSSKRDSLPAAEAVKVTKTPRGLHVASQENHLPVARVAAVFNVGSRDEQYNELGMVHALRAYANLATKNFSSYGLTRRLDHLGVNFSVIADRETLTYCAETTRNNLRSALDAIAEISTKALLRPWELRDSRDKIELDREIYKELPEIRVGEILHKASFKNTLANSVYAPKFNIGNLSCEDTVRNFRDTHLVTSRLVVVGTGISHEELVKLSSEFSVSSDKGKYQREKAVFRGGVENRKMNNDSTVHVSLGFEGASLPSNELFASGLLSHVLGTGPRVKYSAGGSRLARAIGSPAHPAVANSFNINYSDTGLFGVNVIAHKSDVHAVARAALKEVERVGKSGVTSAELENAKNSMKTCLAEHLESPLCLIKGIAASPEHANEYTNIAHLNKAIDSVTAESVNAFAKKIASGKPSLAAIGNLSKLGTLDDLRQ